MTDGIFISQFAGSEQLSATNIVYSCGVSVKRNRCHAFHGRQCHCGKAARRRKGQSCQTAVYTACIFYSGFGCGAGNSFCTDNASDFTGAWRKGRNAGYVCVQYGTIMALGAPFSMLQMLFMPFWTTNDKPKYGLILSLTCGFSISVSITCL